MAKEIETNVGVVVAAGMNTFDGAAETARTTAYLGATARGLTDRGSGGMSVVALIASTTVNSTASRNGPRSDSKTLWVGKPPLKLLIFSLKR